MKLRRNHIVNMTPDQMLGMIMGHALGDALGAPSEHRPYQPYNKRLEANSHLSRYYGVRTCVIGQVTDDTEMAMCILHVLSKGPWDANKVTTQYIDWANSGCPFMGRNTRYLFQNIKTVNGYKKRMQRLLSSGQPISQSNGCLMRAYPLCLTSEASAENDCSLTNPTPICVEAVKVYRVLILYVCDNKDKEDIHRHFTQLIQHRDLIVAHDDAWDGSYRDITENRGWVAHAFYCAFWALYHFTDYKTAIDAVILHSVKGSRVGDTDTNAAIAGAVLGAYYGWDAISGEAPEEFKSVLNADTTTGNIVRPLDYELMNCLQKFMRIVDNNWSIESINL